MNFKYIAMVPVLAAALVGISAITTDNAFATEYDNNQEILQPNACGNGELPLNIGCRNVKSPIPSDENGVTLAANQTFPTIGASENGD